MSRVDRPTVLDTVMTVLRVCGILWPSTPTHSFGRLVHRTHWRNDSNAEVEPRQHRTKLTNAAVVHGRRGDKKLNGVYLHIISVYFHAHTVFLDYSNHQFSPTVAGAQRYKHTYASRAANCDGMSMQLFHSLKSN